MHSCRRAAKRPLNSVHTSYCYTVIDTYRFLLKLILKYKSVSQSKSEPLKHVNYLIKLGIWPSNVTLKLQWLAVLKLISQTSQLIFFNKYDCTRSRLWFCLKTSFCPNCCECVDDAVCCWLINLHLLDILNVVQQ